MNNENGPLAGRVLRLAVATCLVAAPTLGCSESHPVENDAATVTTSDAFVADDAHAADDAHVEEDAAIALVDAAQDDASTEWIEDAGIPEIPDAYYPDGYRG